MNKLSITLACGDYDRDGDVDLFVQLGGAVPGDEFHNALFQNPGQGRSAVTLQLRGVQTNRSAIGEQYIDLRGESSADEQLSDGDLLTAGRSDLPPSFDDVIGT